MKVYEAIAQSLIAEGVTDFFGLMGDGNMWLWGAICRDPKVRGYSARHESMSISMADGYARTTGKVGVAMVTCGPGITQCGTSLIAAYRGKTPVVMIAGEIQPGSKNRTQMMDQRRFVEACNTRFHTITSADNMAEEIAEAFYAARVHRCPVMLNLPMGLQEEDFDWDYEYRPSWEFLPKRMETPAPDILAEVVEKLNLRNFILVGHSMGGLVSLVYSSMYPGRVSRLIVVDSNLKMNPDFVANMRERGSRPTLPYDTLEELQSRYRLRPDGTTAPPERIRYLGSKAGRQRPDGKWQHKFDRNVYAERVFVAGMPCWDKVRIPSLLVRGMLSQRITPQIFEEVKSRCQLAELAEVPNSYHHVTVDNPSVCVREIRAFLDRHA